MVPNIPCRFLHGRAILMAVSILLFCLLTHGIPQAAMAEGAPALTPERFKRDVLPNIATYKRNIARQLAGTDRMMMQISMGRKLPQSITTQVLQHLNRAQQEARSAKTLIDFAYDYGIKYTRSGEPRFLYFAKQDIEEAKQLFIACQQNIQRAIMASKGRIH